MRKRLIPAILIAFILTIVYAVSGYTENLEGIAHIDLSAMGKRETVSSLCWVNDDLYILGESGVYRWTSNENNYETIVDISGAARYFNREQAPSNADELQHWKNAVTEIFAVEDVVYVMHPYSGEIFCVSNEGLTKTATFPKEVLYSDSLENYREIMQTVSIDNHLYILLGTDDYDDPEKTALFEFDIKNETVTSIEDENIEGISIGSDDKLLIQYANDPLRLAIYSPLNEEMKESTIQLQNYSSISTIGWINELQKYYRVSDGHVYVSREFVNEECVAILPITQIRASTSMAASKYGTIAIAQGQYIFLRDLSVDTAARQTVITVAGTLNPDLLIRFNTENPHIVIQQASNSDAITQAALSGDSETDVFILNAPGSFLSMKNKGYLAALEDDSLKSWVNDLYPQINSVVYSEDDLLALPISINLNSWSINRTVWDSIDLGEYPKTYEELFIAIEKWLNEYAVDYPEYALSDVQQNGLKTLVSSAIREYVFQMSQEDQWLSFNTDAFRSVMKTIAQKSWILSEENDQWGMPILSSYSQGFGISQNDGDTILMMLPPAFDSSSVQSIYAELEVMAIHEASTDKEAAVQFMKWYKDQINTTMHYKMNPTLSEPIENENYATRSKELDDELRQLKLSYEQGSTENGDEELYDLIQQKERQLANLEKNRWLISQESIECYRSMSTRMRIPYEAIFFNSSQSGGMGDIEQIIARYCDNGFDESSIDSFILELERVANMIRLEAE